LGLGVERGKRSRLRGRLRGPRPATVYTRCTERKNKDGNAKISVLRDIFGKPTGPVGSYRKEEDASRRSTP